MYEQIVKDLKLGMKFYFSLNSNGEFKSCEIVRRNASSKLVVFEKEIYEFEEALNELQRMINLGAWNDYEELKERGGKKHIYLYRYKGKYFYRCEDFTGYYCLKKATERSFKDLLSIVNKCLK